jgi:hypothetical protein
MVGGPTEEWQGRTCHYYRPTLHHTGHDTTHAQTQMVMQRLQHLVLGFHSLRVGPQSGHVDVVLQRFREWGHGFSLRVNNSAASGIAVNYIRALMSKLVVLPIPVVYGNSRHVFLDSLAGSSFRVEVFGFLGLLLRATFFTASSPRCRHSRDSSTAPMPLATTAAVIIQSSRLGVLIPSP